MSSISDHAIPTVYSLKSLFLPFTVKSESTAKILHIHTGMSNECLIHLRNIATTNSKQRAATPSNGMNISCLSMFLNTGLLISSEQIRESVQHLIISAKLDCKCERPKKILKQRQD